MTPARDPRARRSSRVAFVLGKVVSPLAAYYLLRWAGVSQVGALIGGGSVVAAITVVVAIRRRRVDAASAVVLGLFVLATVLALWTGRGSVLLLKPSVVSGALGLYCLATTFARPLVYQISLRFLPRAYPHGETWRRGWQASAPFRRWLRILNVVWGAGLLLEASARAYIALHVNADQAVLAVHLPALVLLVVLLSVTGVILRGPVARVLREGRGLPVDAGAPPAAGRAVDEPKGLTAGSPMPPR